MSMRATATIVSFFFALHLLAPAVARSEADAILILDASGSMWGQIDEEAKITIAKRVVGDVLTKLPESRRLGLVAYGHRREGDCADIELVAPVGSGREAIRAAVTKITPKGKTPMSDAVKLAAETLRSSENPATVVLVSDGIETCEPDPCGVAAALEAAGADLTVHVVGFDVTEENAQAQLRCLAENTGGVFVPASNADELSLALSAAVAETTEVEPETTLALRATELEGGVVIEEGLVWTVTPAGGEEPVFTKDGAGRVDATVAPGAYDVRVVRTSDGLRGAQAGVTVLPGSSKTVTIALEFPVSATVRAEPAGTGVAGEPLAVHWTGPDRPGDFVSVAKKDADAAAHESWIYVRRGNPAEIRLPVEAGAYEVRYVLGRPYRVLAREDFTVTPAVATLDAPSTVTAGTELDVSFTGPKPGPSDYVTVTEPQDDDTTHRAYQYTRLGSPVSLRAPLEPGTYELRFVQNGRKVLARRPLTVTAAGATLSGPERALTGETVAVAFTGPPPGSGDYVTVTTPDAAGSEYRGYAYARNGSPAQLRMPLEPGSFELRYVQGGREVLARRAIEVVEATATVKGASDAVAGETVEVQFTGPPPGPSDYVTIAAKDASEGDYLAYAYTKQGSPVTLRMPLDPGSYELRFVQAGKKVLARQPIAVTPATATLSAPDSAAADSIVEVEFTGPPPGSGDYVAVSSRSSKDSEYAHYAYTKLGSPAKVRMPKEPGEYELRFIQGSKKVLERRPITVTPAP